MPLLTYIDSCVLIAAFQGHEAAHERATELLADENREFLVSDLLALETVTEARRSGSAEEAEFYERWIALGQDVPLSKDITEWSVGIRSKYSIQPVDLLHIATAVVAGANEFVTSEAPTKAFFSIKAPLKVTSIQ